MTLLHLRQYSLALEKALVTFDSNMISMVLVKAADYYGNIFINLMFPLVFCVLTKKSYTHLALDEDNESTLFDLVSSHPSCVPLYITYQTYSDKKKLLRLKGHF